MSCTAGCLNIILDDEKYMELFAETLMEVMNEGLYEPFEDIDEVLELFDTDGDITFTLDAEPIFSFDHGTEYVMEFLLEFLKKAPDAELNGDYFSDWDNCCDVAFMQFEYKDKKLSLMRLFADIDGMVCEECGEEIEISDVEIYFEGARCLECPECGARFPQQDDKKHCGVFIGDFELADGEWVYPEGFEAF